MTITEMIKVLETIKEKEGDLRVTIFDTYTESEGWDYNNEELWITAETTVDNVLDDNDNIVEKVVLIC